MPLKRYLLYFGYVGTYFRGIQKQSCNGVSVRPTDTVQGLLEICFEKLRTRPVNTPILVPSSRTDAGVHAICSTAHIDLDFDKHNITTDQITSGLNFVLRRSHCSNVNIYKTVQVPNTFSARFNAKSRTYIYRFAVLKRSFDVSKYTKVTCIPLPIIELDKCYFIFDSSLDLDLLSRCCSKFIGTKDFRSFMGSNNAPVDIVTTRTVIDLKLRPGRPLFNCPISDNFDFYEIECTGRAFLYRQVRRMVGALFGVALKKVSVPEIDYLFDNPSKDSWAVFTEVPPGCGLYLSTVTYDESDMILTEHNQIVDKTDSQVHEDEINELVDSEMNN